VHFGVPEPAEVERIVVQWPSGRTQEINGEKARGVINHHVRMAEKGEVELWEGGKWKIEDRK
jgi:hypothetical protein